MVSTMMGILRKYYITWICSIDGQMDVSGKGSLWE